jgi:nitroreductase/dihydropteridine reductase
MTELIDKLHWRYATKKFNPTKIVPEEKIDRILEAVRLTPTSSGLQPFELILVTNPELRARIKPVAWDQQQVVDCSHLLVFAVWDDTTPERVNAMYDLMNEERGGSNPGLEAYRERLLGVLIVPLGYRDEEGDWLVNMKKVRRSRADFVTEMR